MTEIPQTIYFLNCNTLLYSNIAYNFDMLHRFGNGWPLTPHWALYLRNFELITISQKFQGHSYSRYIVEAHSVQNLNFTYTFL